ncbi:serine/threonine-protein kinase TBK1 isoform X1 [Leptinotarsa decemlineata]|uniref:serine/threonine-protein kinase TBK1 isoform X1 n=1 Tax=Leptinotarsa decemlineata TaxID=7539 RepID=UPI003D30C7F6
MGDPKQFGSWQKISDLGSGAFGVVSLWKNNENDDLIAIKKCKFQTHINLTAKQKERWHNEVDIMKIINHPNVIKYKKIPLDLESALLKHNPTKLPLLPMEYCRKGNLRHVLCKSKHISGLEEQDVRYILEDISSGLQHLHNLKITHRDIKPDNIVLQHCDDRIGNTVYKIIDLGYAKELGDTVVSFVGTLHYLAPEIFDTIKYNSSVDYWSMGILTFEIICGVLPFLSHLPPFERFSKIKEKKSEDICIYLNYSGQVTNSSEIKKEHFISKCLEQHLEIWLRHVLTFDPSQRSQNFPGDIKVFDYLNFILKKKIINVFILRKLEFYSYEINEETLVSTLKDWISRDIKIPKDELILLTERNVLGLDDMLMKDIMKDETNVYVTCKNLLMADTITYNFPKLIKEVMKSALKFNMGYIKQLKSQMVYYISMENKTAHFFRTGFYLYVNYITHLVEVVKKKGELTSKEFSKLVTRVECYNSIRKNNICDIDLRNNMEYKDCLGYSRRLVASLERTFSNFEGLEKKVRVMMKRQKVLEEFFPEVSKIINLYDLKDQYLKILGLVEKTVDSNNRSSNDSNNKQMISNITSLISETIRVKNTFFSNKKFKAYLSIIGNFSKYIENLLNWIRDFDSHLQELSKSFEQTEVVYRDILLKAAENTKVEKTYNISLIEEIRDLPIPYLIKENQDLRFKFEDILSKSILAHKMYAESVKTQI